MHSTQDTFGAMAKEPGAHVTQADSPVVLLTDPVAHAEHAVDAAKPEKVPAGHAAQDVPFSNWPAGHGTNDTEATVNSATINPPEAWTTISWLFSGWLAGMRGSVHTIWESVDAVTGHWADATNTLGRGSAGPKPTPAMVRASPPVRLHCKTVAEVRTELQPDTPVTTGSV